MLKNQLSAFACCNVFFKSSRKLSITEFVFVWVYRLESSVVKFYSINGFLFQTLSLKTQSKMYDQFINFYLFT